MEHLDPNTATTKQYNEKSSTTGQTHKSQNCSLAEALIPENLEAE